MNTLYQHLVHWLIANAPVLVWPVATALLSVAIKRGLPEKWEAWALKYPKLAFCLELMKAWGWDLPKTAVLAQRYAQRRAGQVPEDAYNLSTLPEPLKRALQDPAMQKKLEELVASWTATTPAPSPGATPSDPAAPKAVEPLRPEGQPGPSS